VPLYRFTNPQQTHMAMTVGLTKPYRAANGHTMAAPLVVGKHAAADDPGHPVWSWADCVADCAACAGGDHPEAYAGEEW